MTPTHRIQLAVEAFDATVIPRTRIVQAVADACNVSVQTVRIWLRMDPRDPKPLERYQPPREEHWTAARDGLEALGVEVRAEVSSAVAKLF